MGTLQDGFITDIGNLPKELQDRINNGLQTQIIKEAELVKNDMPDYYLSYLDGEIGKAGASMQRMIEESGRDGALLANISKVYVWNKERRKALYNLKETYLRNNEQAVKQPQPEAQITAHEPQQKDLHYYCQKAIEKGYLVKVDGGYRRVRWSKAQLAYFLGHFKKIDGTFPDIEYCNMFEESRLSKALGQLINNKTGYGKPKGYEIVDNILQE